MTTTTTTVTPPDIQPVGLIQTPMHTLLTELVLLCVLLGAAFWAGLGQGNPCNTVYNQVSYPGGVVRDARDLLWDIHVLHSKEQSAWEAKVLYCSLKK